MISEIEIKGLRGIREGKLENFTGLVIQTGPNGSGKSTVLDALLIAASANPLNAAVRVSRRHDPGVGKTRWLLWRSERKGEITIGAQNGAKRSVTLYTDDVNPEPIRIFVGLPSQGLEQRNEVGHITDDGATAGRSHPPPFPEVPEIRLVDLHMTVPLHDVFSEAVKAGKRDAVNGLVQEVIPGAQHLEILTDQGKPVLHVVHRDFSLPVALSGDGVRAAVRISLDLAACQHGVVLLEDPEVHQHPGAMRQTAQAILAAVRSDVQVILSTHSLELIDALLAAVESKDELDKLSLYGLRLDDGCLKSYRLSGPDIAFSRTKVEDDLR